MSITVTAPQTTISVSASGGSVSAAVTASQITAASSGGIGPQGPPGVTTISGASDVQLSSVADGDVLRYSSSKWRNYADNQLTDGGNF
jgi:hypothetical protein